MIPVKCVACFGGQDGFRGKLASSYAEFPIFAETEKALPTLDEKAEILKQYWGYDSFRPLQGEIIDSVLAGKDTLALMPTGGGKSICFQVPGLVREGVCIVVSPLIALMKDQVANLRRRGIKAVAIFSGMRYRDMDRILDNVAYGDTKFLYVSPERLMTPLFLARLQKMRVNLLAVDESHCISQWGYDFRPPYLKIAEIRPLIPKTPVLAVTATATPEVVVDIQERLEFPEKNVFQKSFGRSNLSYSVLHESDKVGKMLDILKRVPGTAVVYARNRRKTRETAEFLQRHRISASFYHAGLDAEERSKRQEDWINDKIRVIVSTNAFGMGIDKPDVRVVIHLDLPDNLEAYFQEAGRGGRDGKKAYAVLLYNEGDRMSLERQYEQSYPSFEEIRRVWRALGSYYQLATGSGLGESHDFDITAFSNAYKLPLIKTYNCLKILEQSGWLSLSEAVHLPPTVKFLIDKEALYDYQLKHRRTDKIIRRILQTHQGGYNRLIVMRQFSQLAYSLKMTPTQLDSALALLHQEGVLEYAPPKDKPQLTFLQERVAAENLDLDQQLYTFRKKRHRERLDKALAYAELPVCRSRQLLGYFGEKDAPNCGICDVCTGRTSSDMTADDFERLQKKVLLLLKRESLSPQEILDSFGPKWHPKIMKVMDYLASEHLVKRGKGGKLELG